MLVFDYGATSKFDDVLFEHGGLPHVLPIAVRLKFSLAGQVVQTILRLFEFVCGTPPSCLKIKGWVVA